MGGSKEVKDKARDRIGAGAAQHDSDLLYHYAVFHSWLKAGTVLDNKCIECGSFSVRHCIFVCSFSSSLSPTPFSCEPFLFCFDPFWLPQKSYCRKCRAKLCTLEGLNNKVLEAANTTRRAVLKSLAASHKNAISLPSQDVIQVGHLPVCLKTHMLFPAKLCTVSRRDESNNLELPGKGVASCQLFQKKRCDFDS